MADLELKEQINNINTKLDTVLQYVEQQRLKTQQIEDLIQDVSIVGTEVFNATVEEMEHQSIELDTDQLRQILIKLIKNVGNINMVINMLESLNDLSKDLSPVIRGITFDVITKIDEYEKKGYFEIFQNLTNNADKIFGTIKLITQPSVLSSLEKVAKVATSLKIDENIDNKSFYKLYKEMKKPEVRQTISFSLRLLQEINKELKKN
ncbi:MAG: hypothetical protein A2046_16985 [Bacteroidetes bacterium GWA2_30_7]|nr:MAG: hypothetical protein A2046_16985 [Bacteroidetes bacterium GWA2_30_7]